MIYLYVKTHNVTGLKYLGKTVSADPHSYPGSGTRWKRHIKKHGNDVTTEILLASSDKEELKETGLFFSKLWNIVNDKNWANIIPESGDGVDSKTSKRINQERVANKTHNFIGENNPSHNRVKKGTHNFQDPSFIQKLVDERNSKNWYSTWSKEQQNTRVKAGTHNFQGVNCIDRLGNVKKISSSEYKDQKIGKDPANWDLVDVRSREGKSRRSIASSF